MSLIGLIQAFNEEENIAAAVKSLKIGGCKRIVVVDGAWSNPDGSPFGGGEAWHSTDDTRGRAQSAGAEYLQSPADVGTDGAKRDWALRSCGFRRGDRIFCLDADEILVGRIDELPSSHACVIHRDLHENDLAGGGVWPRGDYGPEKPLLRLLRWSEDLRCDSPGVYYDAAGRIHAYLVGAMAERAAGRYDDLFAHAHRAIRDLEHHLDPHLASLLPILDAVEIHHVAEPSAERVEAKRRYYAEALAA